MFEKGEIMKKYLICFVVSILMVSGCSPSQTTPKDFVNQLEENELFDANKEDRVCYENFFAELAADEESEMDLNRLSKELDKAVKVSKTMESKDIDFFSLGDECGIGQDSSWTRACALSEKEIESVAILMAVTMGPSFACGFGENE